MLKKYKEHLKNLILNERKSEEQVVINEIMNINCEQRIREGKTIVGMKRKVLKKYPTDCKVLFTGLEKINTEINKGDIVFITGEKGLIKNLTGIVSEINYNTLTVKYVDKPILDTNFDVCRIDLFVKNTTYKRQLDNLSNTDCNEVLRLLLGISIPKTDNPNKKVLFYDNGLNRYQKAAVEKSLCCGSFFLIHGPFGTGKTRTLIELVKQEVGNGNRVLITAESNIAIDNLAVKLIDSKIDMTRVGTFDKFNDKIKKFSLKNKRKTHKSFSEIKSLEIKKKTYESQMQKCDKTKRESIIKGINQLNKEIIRLQRKIDKYIIKNSQVIFTTNSSAGASILQDTNFDIAIVDESAQATIPSVLIPISKADRFVLAGDHKQLAPTISSGNDELKISLFEKLCKMFPQQMEMLKIQYRMNNMLMDFPNREFYNNELICDISVKNTTTITINSDFDNGNSLIFVDTSLARNNYESTWNYSNSYINELEANITKSIVNDCIKSNFNSNDLGVITNYSDQVKLIKSMIDIEVETVDGFQGREKDIIIISNVRSNKQGEIGFLDEPRRLNVALTRAKSKLIIIGNSKTLSNEPMFKRLFDYCNENESVIFY